MYSIKLTIELTPSFHKLQLLSICIKGANNCFTIIKESNFHDKFYLKGLSGFSEQGVKQSFCGICVKDKIKQTALQKTCLDHSNYT